MLLWLFGAQLLPAAVHVQRTLANSTGASALIMRTSSSDFMICADIIVSRILVLIICHNAMQCATCAHLFDAGKWQLRVFELTGVASALLHLLNLGRPKLLQRLCVCWVGCHRCRGDVHGHVAGQHASLRRLGADGATQALSVRGGVHYVIHKSAIIFHDDCTGIQGSNKATSTARHGCCLWDPYLCWMRPACWRPIAPSMFSLLLVAV